MCALGSTPGSSLQVRLGCCWSLGVVDGGRVSGPYPGRELGTGARRRKASSKTPSYLE